MRNEGLTVTVIGGGSTYTPELIEGLIRYRRQFPVARVRLMDIDRAKLTVVGGLAKRMVKTQGVDTSVTLTTDLNTALHEADYVFAQIRVGGLAARIRDERIPLSFGVIGQETTGPGGFAKALRTVPVMLDIARRMERLCPNAWLINFTNPSGIVTEALLNHSRIKVLGLCNAPLGFLKEMSRFLGVPSAEIRLDYVGLNHLSWIRRVFVRHQEVTKEVLRHYVERAGSEEKRLLRTLRAIPNGYLHYYYFTDEVLARQKSSPRTRGEQVLEIEKSLLEKYRRPTLARKPPELSKRGGAYYSEVALALAKAIHASAGEWHIVNVRNGSTLRELPEECAVEAPCIVDALGAHPLPAAPLQPEIAGLLRNVKAYEQLTVRAAVEGDERAAVMALTTHPLVPSFGLARRLWTALKEANRDYLPQFFGRSGSGRRGGR